MPAGLLERDEVRLISTKYGEFVANDQASFKILLEIIELLKQDKMWFKGDE